MTDDEGNDDDDDEGTGGAVVAGGGGGSGGKQSSSLHEAAVTSLKDGGGEDSDRGDRALNHSLDDRSSEDELEGVNERGKLGGGGESSGLSRDSMTSPVLTTTKSKRASMSSWLKKKFARGKNRQGIDGNNDREGRDSSSTYLKTPRAGGGGGGASGASGASGAEEETSYSDLKESSDYVDPDYEMEAFQDLSFCPMGIKIIDHKSNRYRFNYYYMMNITPLIKILPITSSTISANHDHIPIRLKSYGEIAKHLSLIPFPKMYKNKKLSLVEQRRRQIIESYRLMLKNATTSSSEGMKNLKSFLLPISEIENAFLGGNITLYEKYDKENYDRIISWEGYIAMALSRRHFTEYYLIVTRESLVIRKNRDSKKTIFSIPCDRIVSVQSLPNEYCPIPEFNILQIETYCRCYYFLVRSNLQVNQWLEVFITILGNKCMNSPYRMIDLTIDKSTITYQTPSPQQRTRMNNNYGNAVSGGNGSPNGGNNSLIANNNNNSSNSGNLGIGTTGYEDQEVYYERPVDWKADKRRIYNYRRIFFTAMVGERYNSVSPNDLILSILKTIFFLNESENTATEYDWVKFWDEISLLQCIDLRKLTEIEKTAFFLNLYHVMVLHGQLVFGPPNHGLWNAFFSNICKYRLLFVYFF
jgi:hypothetical protein